VVNPKGRPRPQPATQGGRPNRKTLLLGSRIYIHRLEIFIAVARAGSMSAAGQALGRTQSSITQVIKGLEAEIGVALFDRSVRPTALTMRGNALLQHAIAVVESVRRLESSLRLGEAMQLPILRIGIPNSFATTLGPFIIKELRTMAARWQVRTGFNATRIDTLLDHSLDFVVAPNPPAIPPTLVAQPLFSEPYVVVLPASVVGGPTAILDAMSRLSLVSFGRDADMRSRFEKWFEIIGVMPEECFQLDTAEGAVQMVAAGLGWSLLPPLAIIRMLERGDPIRAVVLPGDVPRRLVSVVRRLGEGDAIAERISQIAAGFITETILPAIRLHLPDVHDQIQLLYSPR
jgi:DNA-binding transcriptional LysR family regulator